MRGRSRTAVGRFLDGLDFLSRAGLFLRFRARSRDPLYVKPDHDHELDESNISASESAEAARRLREREAEEHARDSRDT